MGGVPRGHGAGIGTVPAAAVPALMHGDALAAMEDLDHAGGHAGVDLLPAPPMRHRIEKSARLAMIVDRDPAEARFGDLVIGVRQLRQGGPVHCLEELPAAD